MWVWYLIEALQRFIDWLTDWLLERERRKMID